MSHTENFHRSEPKNRSRTFPAIKSSATCFFKLGIFFVKITVIDEEMV